MEIKVSELRAALETVKPALANKEIIEQSTSFAFLGDRIVTYNDEISISHPVENLNLTGAVHAEELYEYLKLTNKAKFRMKVTDNELLLQAGSAKAWMTLQKDIVLPLDEVDAEKDWHGLPEDFTHNLMFVKDSTSYDMSRRVLTCVHVSENRLEASDGFQLMRLFIEGWPLGNYLIPAENISEIHKIEPHEVAESDGWLHFRNYDNTEISVRILEDKYPQTDEHYKMTGDKVLFPKDMHEILERARVFTKKEHEMDEEMVLHIKGNKLLVHGKNQYGRFKEQTKVKHKGEGGKFWITPLLLQNILKRSSRCIINKEKLKFKGEDWEFVCVLKSVEDNE